MNINNLVKKILLEIEGDPKEVKTKVDVNDPKSVLTLAITDKGCFQAKNKGIGGTMQYMKKDTATACGVPENSLVVSGKEGNADLYFFGIKSTVTPNPDKEGDILFQMCKVDGSTVVAVDKGPVWKCAGIFSEVKDLNTSILSAEQEAQLKNYVAQVGGSYSQYPPEGYTEQEYDKIDVKKIAMLGNTFLNFPENSMFIWVRKGLMNATPDQVQEVRNLIDTLTPKLSTTIPKAGTTRMSWCITGKGLFPTESYLPPGITYENLKARLDDPNSGIKKGSWTLFCPDESSIRTVNSDSSDMNKCRNAIKYLYSCKTKGGRSKFNRADKTNPSAALELGGGTESACFDFKRQFKERYLAYSCSTKKMYDKTIDILGVGIKNEVNNLLSDLTTDYGLGSFNKNLRESVVMSNSLDFTINKVVLEAINNKKSNKSNSIQTILKKNLLEEFKKRSIKNGRR